MTIAAGDRLPALTLKRLNPQGEMEEVELGSLFAGKKAVLFSVPGAFTPTCSARHLPGFVQQAEALRGKGVDLIACTAVNDPFVMRAWAKEGDPEGRVEMLPDGNGALAEALGLTMDASGANMGKRGQRFALIVEDGVVRDVAVEEPRGFNVSSAESVLSRLG